MTKDKLRVTKFLGTAFYPCILCGNELDIGDDVCFCTICNTMHNTLDVLTQYDISCQDEEIL